MECDEGVVESSDWACLRRYLVMGYEAPKYTSSDKEPKRAHVKAIKKLIKNKEGMAVLNEIRTFLVENRPSSIKPAIFALAIIAKDPDVAEVEGSDVNAKRDKNGAEKKDKDGTEKKDTDGTEKKDTDGTEKKDTDGTEKKDTDGTEKKDTDDTKGKEKEDPERKEKEEYCKKLKRGAYAIMLEHLTLPTHLFMFLHFCKAIRKHAKKGAIGFGRSSRSAISKWYNNKEPRQLAYHLTKYKQRHGWSHRDVLRLTHVKPTCPQGTLSSCQLDP